MAGQTAGGYTVAGTPPQVGGPQVGSAPIQNPQAQVVPFRVATTERNELVLNLTNLTALATAVGEQTVENQIPGSGYLYGLYLEAIINSGTNSATVVWAEDAPFSLVSQVSLRDVTGPIIDTMDGFSLYWMSRYGGWTAVAPDFTSFIPPTVATAALPAYASSDTNVANIVPGAVATAGTARFHLKVPVALNRRTLLGLQGNQDRAQAYVLRTNVAPTGSFYRTPPTTPQAPVYKVHYESYAVPNAQNNQGIQNQVIPPFYGVIPYITKSVNANAPIANSTVNHYLQRLNTTIRTIMLVARANNGVATARADMEAQLPSNVQFKVGNQVIYNETVQARRKLMFDRYGFDAPAGVLVYDRIHDFSNLAGSELGFDWIWAQNIVDAQFQISYGNFTPSTPSLTVVTSDMVVPEGMNLLAA
jgi:hypothetical protein